MRLIDADAFKLHVQRCILIDEDLSTEQIERYLLAAIDGFTEIDAVPVVRCKDCKYFKTPLCQIEDNHDNWFCADGERKDGND